MMPPVMNEPMVISHDKTGRDGYGGKTHEQHNAAKAQNQPHDTLPRQSLQPPDLRDEHGKKRDGRDQYCGHGGPDKRRAIRKPDQLAGNGGCAHNGKGLPACRKRQFASRSSRDQEKSGGGHQ